MRVKFNDSILSLGIFLLGVIFDWNVSRNELPRGAFWGLS